ncbi:MAG: SPW repeat protein [Paracoccaceae bacterium]
MTTFSKKLSDNWQDGISLILGIWLFMSPWLLGFTGLDAAFWNAVAFGLVIVLMALMALFEFHEWEEWADMVIGAWLVVSPWVLGFAMFRAGADGPAAIATWDVVIVGVLTFLLAIGSLRHHREHMA